MCLGETVSDMLQSFSILLCGYLGGFSNVGSASKDGRLLTIEEVGEIMNGNDTRDTLSAQRFNRGQFLSMSKTEMYFI